MEKVVLKVLVYIGFLYFYDLLLAVDSDISAVLVQLNPTEAVDAVNHSI